MCGSTSKKIHVLKCTTKTLFIICDVVVVVFVVLLLYKINDTLGVVLEFVKIMEF